VFDASDYGIYGCVDTSFCKIDSGFPTCPTTAADETLFSNHPLGCIPGVNCFSAINYHENANINSSTCHYVSLSIPSFVIGDTNTIARVPIYFKNDSSANINSIAYTLSFDGGSSGILSYDTTIFSGTVISALGVVDTNIVFDSLNRNISVNIPIPDPENALSSGIGILTDIFLFRESKTIFVSTTPNADITVPENIVVSYDRMPEEPPSKDSVYAIELIFAEESFLK
jgi:hypothetical protein